MLILRLWNFIRGYVEFRLEGLNLERVLNLIIDKNIYLWDIKRINYTTIEAKAGAKGYQEIEQILNKTGCKGQIYSKTGLPFFVFKLKRRKTILAGLVISLLIIVTISSFIWTVDVNCESYLLERDVLIFLQKVGLKPGIYKNKINIPMLENDLLINYDRIAWVDIDISGTKASVNIIEKKLKPKNIKPTEPCDIVAKKVGIIEKVTATEGDAVVKKGEIVKPNQILISGTIKRNDSILRYVHSMGEVYARTNYEKKESMLINKIIKNKTGKSYSRRIVKIGSASIVLGSDNIPFEKYVMQTQNKSFGSWRNIKIPVEIINENYYEIDEKSISISEEDIQIALKEKLLIDLIPQIPAEAKILNQNIVYNKDGDIITGILSIEVLESIGAEKIIKVQESIEENEKNN